MDLAPRDDATVAPEEDASQAPDQLEQPELEEVSAEPQEQEQDPEPQETNEPAAPLPAFLRQPMVEPEDAMAAAPAALSATYRLRQIDAAKAAQIAPLVTQLTALRDSMAARRRGGGTATPNT